MFRWHHSVAMVTRSTCQEYLTNKGNIRHSEHTHMYDIGYILVCAIFKTSQNVKKNQHVTRYLSKLQLRAYFLIGTSKHLCCRYLTLSHIQQICSRLLWKYTPKKWKLPLKESIIIKQRVWFNQQTTFDNIEAKREIAHHDQFLLLAQFLLHYS